ncbi:MAG: 3-oxoadipate enol-lactonase [Proteobacteria bacterium]|nr:3-oxoadipate enol-lactonase [Pseudomonadota bacterium]
MASIEANGCKLHVEIEGPANAPVLMLSNSLGATLQMWDDQAPAFAKEFRLVRYDRRGHGQSDVPAGPYTMEMLGRDALAVMDGLGLRKVSWCGLSMGGMVGQWLGANAPERIDKLILSNTSSHYPVKDAWNERIKAVSGGGVAAIADNVLKIWFTGDFIARAPEAISRMREMMVATPSAGYIGCSEAVRDMDLRDALARITAPTLVIAGRHDKGTTVENAEFIRAHIPGASLTILNAAHISNVEAASDFTAEVLGFLAQ